MTAPRILSVLAAALALAGCAATAAVTKPAFGTTHVTLYDCGLAQIEKQADVKGASTLEIRIEQAHLDDLLASLVLATDGSVKVKGVKFPSIKNLGQAVASSGFAGALFNGSDGIELPQDLAGYVQGLSGTGVVVTDKDGKQTKGTVLDAVFPPEGGDGAKPSQDPPLLVVVTQDGTLRWIPIPRIAEIAPASTMEATALKNFASSLGKANGFNESTLVVETTGDSKGRLAASYVRQTPVWRMLYKTRVKEGKVTLEAWAVVHNDTPEDWTDVGMTLISGLPSSYVLSVASPRYVYRDVIEAPGGLAELMPQLGAQTPDSLLYSWDVYHASAGMIGYGAGGGGGYGYGAGGLGVLGTIGYGGGSGGDTASSSLLAVGESAAAETAEPKVEDEISTYTAMSSVNLPSGATSLVPLISRDLPGQSFTLLAGWEDPETCVRMENGTGLVLQPGLSSFYVDGRFRGEAEIDRLEPGDVRVLCYGSDMDVTFTRDVESEDVYTALEWKDDALWVHSLRTTVMDYAIENAAGQARGVAVEITHIENGRVVEPTGLLGTEAPTRELHPLTLPARSETPVHVVVEEGVMTRVELTTEEIDRLLLPGTLPQGDTAALKAARVILAEKEKLARDAQDRKDAVAENEEAIKFQKDLLAAIPAGGAAAKSVDGILAEIKKASKKISALQKEILALELKIADLRKKAEAPLKGLAPKKPPAP